MIVVSQPVSINPVINHEPVRPQAIECRRGWSGQESRQHIAAVERGYRDHVEAREQHVDEDRQLEPRDETRRQPRPIAFGAHRRDETKRTIAATTASTRLLAGPAAAISMNFCRQLAPRRAEFTGTGFAHPMSGRFVTIAISGKRIVPIGSMCTTGFSEMRPSSRAVESPSRSAVQACEASCTVSETSRTTNPDRSWAKSIDICVSDW